MTWSRILSHEAVAEARAEAVAVSFWQAVSAGDSTAIGGFLAPGGFTTPEAIFADNKIRQLLIPSPMKHFTNTPTGIEWVVPSGGVNSVGIPNMRQVGLVKVNGTWKVLKVGVGFSL